MNKKITELLDLIVRDKALVEASDDCIRLKKHLNISGVCEQEKGYLAASLAHRHAKKPLIIASDPVRARSLAASLAPFVNGDVAVLMPSELSLVSAVASSRDTYAERAGIIARIYNGDCGAAIICAGALLNKLPPVGTYSKQTIKLRLGDTFDPSDLAKRLTEIGYERTSLAEAAGEFSWRGDIVDVFPPDRSDPLRIAFFDDEIDQIKLFDKDSQRSLEQLKKATIVPAFEFVIDPDQRRKAASKVRAAAAETISTMNSKSSGAAAELLRRASEEDADAIENGRRISAMARWLGVLLEPSANILDYASHAKYMVMADELAEIRSRMDSYTAEYLSRLKAAMEIGGAPEAAAESVFRIPDIMKRIDSEGSVTAIACLASSGNGLPGGRTVNCISMASDSWRGREADLAKVVSDSKGSDRRVVFMVTGKQRVEALVSNLLERGATPDIVDSSLPSGFTAPALDLMLIGEQDVFGAEKKMNRSKRHSSGINFFSDIKPGDYVVHDVHGIGRYEGITNLRMNNSAQDYLKITYAKNAIIYLPLDRLDRLQKYVGPNGREPKLSSLDSQEWSKSVEKARSSIKKVAFDLIKLYASRRANKGFRCDPDDAMQKEFEENFPYVETEDQLRAIRDIKRDMESDTPMDRLLCGDVGYGKTEVAFRAMFKCVANNRQAFMLAPTTLLAQQHYDNLIERLNGFPVRVALLSRFVPLSVMKQNLKDIKEGKVDIVIGTHRLLSKDVVPARLGLLVVDEEQRFGVNHKEQIKAMRSNIDVLTLTATPIPRTLHMSMSGIRDISVLDEAPMNRRPVQTYVIPYNEEITVQACMREIARGGQVFYLYNRTSDIDLKAGQLSQLMPGARIVYAHGKMSEHQMEKIIESFVRGEADILVCTTIIESGVDMPNVNTMIVEDADRFGLAQLYQIKGRVGRSDRQAYAYMTFNEDKEMSSDARKRLMAIREFTELGSGVKVALRDLEVRGAGNLLGAEQHGQMDVIGYELYCRLLDEEIKLLQDNGEFTPEPELHVNMEVDFDSYIPTSYISDEVTRMTVYRRIGDIRSEKDYDDFMDEVIDRYGDPPKEVVFLAGASMIRSMAAITGFERVCFKEAGVLLYFAGDRKIDMKAVGALVGTPEYAGRILISATGKPYMHYKPRSNRHDRTVTEVKELLQILIENKS